MRLGRKAYCPLMVGSAMVLDSGDGPELCLGPIALTLPPDCTGPPVDGWTWPEKGTRRTGSVAWGDFFVVGTWDGERLTFEKVVTEEQASASLPPTEVVPDLGTPCPEPAGGWGAVDARRSTSDDQQQVLQLAGTLPGYVELWVDDRGSSSQDPSTTVVDVEVTHDVAGAERRIRTVWGGPLCVFLGARTQQEVRRVQRHITGEPGVVSSGSSRGVLTVELVWDDGTRRRGYDTRYGVGLVTVTSALHQYQG